MGSGRLAELVIGPACGRTRWLGPGMTSYGIPQARLSWPGL
jgi:hypothetical protein